MNSKPVSSLSSTLAISEAGVEAQSRWRRHHSSVARVLSQTHNNSGLVDFIVGRILDQLGVPQAIAKRWGGDRE